MHYFKPLYYLFTEDATESPDADSELPAPPAEEPQTQGKLMMYFILLRFFDKKKSKLLNLMNVIWKGYYVCVCCVLFLASFLSLLRI